MIKRVRIWMLTLTAIALILWPVGRFLTSRSDAYQVATRFISTNPVITQAVGKVTETRLGWLDISMSFGWGNTGFARLPIAIEGTVGHGEAMLELEKELGLWQVKTARFASENKIQQIDVKN